ncbi:hypothetical protein N7444_001575 [Penicillium canescens]|nr:hypothetical protein N7444_001575 [Penicillium canescens]
MHDFRHPRNMKKCLYPYDSGVIQLNVQRLGQNSDNNSSWMALVDQSTGSGNDVPAHIARQITCALHPTLSGNDRLSWSLDRLRLKYVNGVDVVSAEKQIRASSAIISCNLPHLYPTASNSETSSELDVSWGAYDAIITLLQTHFRHCKQIMLVLWTDRTISLWRRETGQENDAMLARLEKVLIRADELHRTLAQQGCEFSIFPSPAAFELCLDQAKESGGVLEEGDWDQNRGAESRVWRSIEPQLGNWIRTSFFDTCKREDMEFV